MFKKESIVWLSLLGFILIHVQMNIHAPIWFIATAVLSGFIPVANLNFLKFALLEVVTLSICLFLNQPDTVILETLGIIIPVGGLGIIALTALISTITYGLVANTTYQLFGRKIFKF